MDARQTSPYVYLYSHNMGYCCSVMPCKLSQPTQPTAAVPAVALVQLPWPQVSTTIETGLCSFCFANDDNRLQLTLKLNSHTIDGQAVG